NATEAQPTTGRKKKHVGSFADDRLVDLPPAIQDLLLKGQDQGFITHQELSQCVPEAEDNLVLLDDLYELFLELNVEVVDVKDTILKQEVKEVVEKPTKKKEEKIIDLQAISDDSVRMYLSEIGKVALLNAVEEVTLAQKVRKGDPQAKKQLV